MATAAAVAAEPPRRKKGKGIRGAPSAAAASRLTRRVARPMLRIVDYSSIYTIDEACVFQFRRMAL